MRLEFRSTVLAAALLFSRALGAPAQEPSTSSAAGVVASATWVSVRSSTTTPLRRVISVDLQAANVRQAIAEIAKSGNVAIGYGDDVTRSKARVSLKAGGLTVAQALTGILEGTGLEAYVSLTSGAVVVRAAPPQQAPAQTGTIVGRVTDAKSGAALAGATVMVDGTRHSGSTGNDGRYRLNEVPPGTYTLQARYIGFAPGSGSVTVSADQEATADLALEKSAQRLDEVVTTGTVVPTEVKALPTPISVVTSDDIQRQNLQRIDQAFRGQVPGAIAWDRGPGNDYTTAIAVRGASALLGTPSIKTFIDGVEVADPHYIATIDPNSVDRIELIRGPQASTLYGAGALNGVMQIFTKKGLLGLTRPQVSGKASVGGIGGFDGQSTALQTDNALSVLGGGEKTSYNLGGSYRRVGEWVPSYHLSDWSASAGGQTTQGPFTLSSSARYADQALDLPWDTRFQSYAPLSQPYYYPYRFRQQTYGATASLQATHSWRHTLTVGYDQTYWSYDQTQPRFTSPADSLLVSYASHASTTSLLYHSDLRLAFGRAAAAVITAGVNYDAYDYIASSTNGATHVTGSLDGSTSVSRAPSHNTGSFGQIQLSLAERLFLTGGLRAEQNPEFGTSFGTAWSPRVGAAYVIGAGWATAKLRASYGEGIRPPTPGLRDLRQTPTFQILANANLAPEGQRGADAGIELYLGRSSLGITYYNQRAINLIDLITLPSTNGLPTYQYQNVSRVKNEGWEFEGRLATGRVELAGTYSITRSRVQALPAGYTGDYQVGDRILAIPYTSAGATLAYSPLAGTTVTAGMTHIGHWTNYDFVSLYATFYGGQPYRGSFRAYWMEYPTVTKFALGVSQVVRKSLDVFVRAENVGNNLHAEVTNDLIPTPRSVLVGANVRY
jgi:outer membrane receptor protein involved in Fe transport